MKYTSRNRYAVIAALSMIGMGGVCADPYDQDSEYNEEHSDHVLFADASSQNSTYTRDQRDCAFGPKCDWAPDRHSNVWVSGDFIIWGACEDGFSCQFGDTTINTTIVNSIPTTAITEHDKDIDFKWEPGFRVGAGVDWPCSGWETAVMWTHYNGKGNGHDGHNHAHWWLHFNVADAILARNFWIGSCVYLKPFTGLRYAIIKQGLRAHLETDIIAATGASVAHTTLHDKQSFWGLGPELGLEADVYIGCRWSLYASLAGAIIYGHTITKFRDKDLFTLAANTCKASGDSCTNQMVLDMAIGIRWEFKYLTFSAGLEDHNYFDYNHIGCGGNLNLYGANVSAAVHF